MEKQPLENNSSDDLDLEQMLRAIKRLGLVDELHPDSEFLDIENDYEINLPLEDGETYIQKIASQANWEYEWVYDEESSLWRHRKNHKVKKIINKRTKQVIQHGLEVHPDFKNSSRDSEVYYHLHPVYKRLNLEQSKKEIDLMIVLNQLPSPEDAKFFIESGYNKARIISEMGVVDALIDKDRIYTLINNPTAKRDEFGKLFALKSIIPKYPSKQVMLEKIVEYGQDIALVKILEQITNDCDGLIRYSFRKIHKT